MRKENKPETENEIQNQENETETQEERPPPYAETLETITTGIQELDQLLQGGLPVGTMNQIFGTRMVGKSILSFQLAFQYLKQQDRNVLYFDTELGFNKSIRPYWYPTYAQNTQQKPAVHTIKTRRYGQKKRKRKAQAKEIQTALQAGLNETDIKYTKQQIEAATHIFLPQIEIEAPTEKTPTIYILEQTPVQDILATHGIQAQIQISEGGRVETRAQPGTQLDIRQTPIGQFIEEHNIGLIIYDSISAPMKATFVGLQDLPGRSASQNLWFGQAQKAANIYNLTVIATSHETIDPITGQRKYYGGGPVGFDFKYTYHLRRHYHRANKKIKEALNPKASRQATHIIWLQRHPNTPPYGAALLLKLDDNGFNTP